MKVDLRIVLLRPSQHRHVFTSSKALLLAMQISNYFTEKLLRIVCDILHHFKGKNKMEGDETSNPGSSKPLDSQVHKGDAALEFIKHVCAVLALDQNVQHDILVYPISNLSQKSKLE